MDCNICCENMNQGNRREVKCPYCEFTSCLICFRRYLMESVKPTPDCMSCHKDLQLEFLAEVTPKNFHNQEYRKKRTKDLLSQERSLLPETQYLVEERNAKLKREEVIAELLEEEQKLRIRIREIRESVSELRNMNSEKSKKEEKNCKKFVMGCPNGDCRGFLSQAWKCGTCGIYACNKCRVVKNGNEDKEHKCDENLVKTYNLLKADTKPCPKCAVPIFYINGCDQMWCTQCHTPFSWRTGDIVTGVIHNPHFYQWQRENNNGVVPRVPDDRPDGCGGLPWPHTIRLVMKQRKHKFKNFDDCHRLLGHIRDVVIPRYPATIGIRDNTDLRVQYLCNEIDEDKWEKMIGMRLKKSEKDRAVNQVLDMFVITMTDLFNTYVTGVTNDLENESSMIRSYVNRELFKIGKQYNNKVPCIDNKWECQ